MPEEIPPLPVSEQEVQIKAPSFWEKISAQKKKILVGLDLFLGILFIAGVTLGAYKLGQRQVSPPPTGGPTPTPELVATPTPNPTADWETYTNTRYGYSIKYPQNITAKTDEAQDLVSFEFPEEGKWVADLSIKHYRNSEGLGPQGFWQKLFNEGKLEAQRNNWPPPSEPLESETIKINNLEGFQVRNSAYEAYQRVTYLGQEKIMVAISFYDENPNDPAQDEHLRVFNLILSTFKFLEEVTPLPTPQLNHVPTLPTTDWKTVSNNGVSFKIPSGAICDNDNLCAKATYTWDYQGHPTQSFIYIEVSDYKGESRRELFLKKNTEVVDCQPIYEETLFGEIKALQVAVDGGLCQGSSGGIVTVVGNKFVSFGGGLNYNLETKVINRWPIRDTIISTLQENG